MRVLVAPDKFAGTLSAAEAAAAIAAGWRRAIPGDRVECMPMSDGGPGFASVLHAALGGMILEADVTGPVGDPAAATVLVAGDTAYIESAQACGLHLVPVERRDPWTATTWGVGEMVAAALQAGVRRVVVGLGGSATNDGGAGMLAALGARPAGVLRRGASALNGLDVVDLSAARAGLARVELVAAGDVDNPLLGPRGASCVFAPQKGATSDQVRRLEAALEHWAACTDDVLAGKPGAGAAGGLGFGLMLLGASPASGIALVAEATGLAAAIAAADLVVTGEGRFDATSLHGKVTAGVAALARGHGTPCVVLAGQVRDAHADDLAAAGIAAAYAVADSAGSVPAALDRPAHELTALAARVAKLWSRAR